MKQFFQYFKDFHKDYFNIWMYGSCLLFMAVLIYFNYTYPKHGFEDSFIDSYAGTNLRPIFFFLTHIVAYLGCLIIIWLFRRKKDEIFTKKFFLKITLAFAILSWDRSIYFYKELRAIAPWDTIRFYYNCISNVTSVVFMLLPLLFFKYIFDKNEKFGMYGLKFKNVNFMPYWIMLAFMSVIIFSAITFIPEIQNYYPTYRRVGGARFANYYQISEVWAKVIYEFIYTTDFIWTELFFRGVLIIGFAKMLGKNAIIPMAATYAALHFGKPMAETISSIFGGYILGIIALYSRNIWGGVFIHGGIALLMDVFGMMKMK